MLNIYYGRESVDKDRFMFDKIKDCGRTLLLVPDQFTLQAEKDAFKYLEVKGLMDVEIISMTRLGARVLGQLGGGKAAHIDKYGRHMLLAKILMEENANMEVFKNLHGMNSFIEMANNLISEMKQHNTSPSALEEIIENLEGDSILKRKLQDIHRIYEDYEAQIQGKYVDTEDYINIFLPKISKAHLILGSTIWAYGFDYFAPKNVDILEQLMRVADVNLVMTYDEGGRDRDLFDITGMVISRLCKIAEGNNIRWNSIPIKGVSEKYELKEGGGQSVGIKTLERELYALPIGKSEEAAGITLLRGANIYGEAESAAAYVLSLVRDKGLRYRDILVICNDLEARGSIIKRVFKEYGIELFLDKKRSILQNPAVGFVLYLVDITWGGWRSRDVLGLMKTGFTDLDQGSIEELENYIIKYKIRGTLWKKDFTKGLAEYGEERLLALNLSRKALVESICRFEENFRDGEAVGDKISALYYFLRDDARLPEKLKLIMDEAEAFGYRERALETAQIWGEIVNIFDQFIELTGAERLSAKNLSGILRAGFEAVEIGILPPSADDLMLGTMQRTRSGQVKALVVLGANEGILPANPSAEGILSEDEKILLLGKGIEICKVDELRAKEEAMAIYRNLSKPSIYLWMSCAISDGEGKEIKPSPIFTKLTDIFPALSVEKDILNRDDPLALIEAKGSTLKHMAFAMRDSLSGQELAEEWTAVSDWYREKECSLLSLMEKGLLYGNGEAGIGKKLAEALYKKDWEQDFTLSPSRLEKYSRCPFAHFINYGLRPDERRVFEIAGREIGDIYHACLMKLSASLTVPGIPVTSQNSPWMTVPKEQVEDMVGKIIEEEISSYKEGMLSQGQEELYRAGRIQRVCGDMGWILIGHVRSGEIEAIAFEEEFGRAKDKPLPAMEVELPDGTVFIEGKIDRVDRLAGGRVKVIDYKSGREKFDLGEVESGWRLQLMLYLGAACQEGREHGATLPGGVFYFRIGEPLVDAEGIDTAALEEKISAEVMKSFKLDGVMVDDPQVIRSIAGEFTGYSDIVQLRATAQGIKGTGEGRLLSGDEFAKLQEAVSQKVKELCSGLTGGNISASPKRTKNTSACEYCGYRSICRFDPAFPGCDYES